MRMKVVRTASWVIAFLLVGIPSSLSAQTTIAWDGDTDSVFSTDTNWVGDIAPANDLTTNIAQLRAAPSTFLPLAR